MVLASGEVLIKSGESDRALYFVASGALEVTARTDRADALGMMIRELPGAVLGEISFFDGRPRTAAVWATKPTQLLRLDLEGWRAFAAMYPTLGHELLFALGRVLAWRMRRGEERVTDRPSTCHRWSAVRATFAALLGAPAPRAGVVRITTASSPAEEFENDALFPGGTSYGWLHVASIDGE